MIMPDAVTANTATNTPAARGERYATLDILRGIAVLAIFAVNIKGMAAPFAYYANASLWPGPYDMAVATVQAFLIDDKWRAIFTGLFGAGVVLMGERAGHHGISALRRLARRNVWLLMFGLIHLFLIWMGDILTLYALAGFLAMLLWRKPVKSLWRWAIGLFILAYLWVNLMNISLILVPEARAEVLPLMWLPGADYLREAMEVARSANPGIHIADRAASSIGYIFFYMLLGGGLVETLATMVAGMALWKNGFLKGALSTRCYMRIALWGLAIAVLTDTGRWLALISSQWSFDVFILSQLSNFFNGLAGAIGFAALIMAWVKSGARLTPLARTGQMAFTNYIACSLIGTTIAYGHGFGRFGTLTNFELMGIVGITWICLVIFSTLWLALFRFGPLEWLWRSLTYGKIQPLLRG